MLVAHYPLDEDSGTTAYDHTGNGYDGTVTGATVGATGLLGTGAYSFDGTDDYVGLGTDLFSFGQGTIVAWVNPASAAAARRAVSLESVFDLRIGDPDGDGTYQLLGSVYDGTTGYTVTLLESPGTATWYHAAVTIDGTTLKGYLDGTLQSSVSAASPGFSSYNRENRIGSAGTAVQFWDGEIGQVRIYDHVLTPAEVQYLYDVGTTGTILTATKTHGSAISPDLRANVTLNAQAATAYVIGSPATASEEVQSVSLSTGSNDYTLSWASTHSDFRVEVVADLSDPTTRVETTRVALLA